MKLVILALLALLVSGCMTVPVEVFKCGDGNVTIHIILDKTVDTLPIDAKARDVQVPLVP